MTYLIIDPWQIWTIWIDIFKLISVNDGWSNTCEIVLKLLPLEFTDDKST